MSLKNRLLLFIAFGLVLFHVACNAGKKKYIIPEKQFIDVLVDMHLADAMAIASSLIAPPQAFDSSSLYGSVFDKYKITRAEFDSSIVYYSRKPEKLEKLYTKVSDRLSQMESEMNEGEKREEAEKKITIWQDPKIYSLPKMGANNRIEISLPVSKPGYYTVSAKIKLYEDDQTVAPRMTLYFWYDNGTPTGFREYFRNLPIARDNKLSTYTATYKLTNPQVTHLKGYILDHSNPDTSFVKHAVISEISVQFSE